MLDAVHFKCCFHEARLGPEVYCGKIEGLLTHLERKDLADFLINSCLKTTENPVLGVVYKKCLFKIDYSLPEFKRLFSRELRCLACVDRFS